MQAALAPLCETADLREFSPPRIPFARESQSQIDCEGFDYFGEKRLAEFVFADDELVLIWILVDADDKPAILAQMQQTYGEDGLAGEGFTAFIEHQTAWRDEPAEVLFYGDRAAPLFAAHFSSR